MNPDAQHPSEITRRSLLRTAAAAIGTAVSPSLIPAAARSQGTPPEVGGEKRSNARQPAASSFLDVIRLPDEVTTFDHFEKTLPKGRLPLSRSGGKWVGKGVVVECGPGPDSLTLGLESPQSPVAVVHVRWQTTCSSSSPRIERRVGAQLRGTGLEECDSGTGHALVLRNP